MIRLAAAPHRGAVRTDPRDASTPPVDRPADAAALRPAASRPAETITALQRDRDRLRRLAERQRSWSDAALDTSATLLRGVEEQPLASLASRLRVLAAVDEVTLARVHDDGRTVRVVATSGVLSAAVVGGGVPAQDGAIGAVIRAGQPRLEPGSSPSASDLDRRGPRMVVPMRSADRVVGAVLVGRAPGGTPFDTADLAFLATFVDHATVAIELAEARVDRERAALLEDRARIARDLHDTAIQQLFAAGLELRAAATTMVGGALVDDVLHAVGLVDAAIGQIRTAVLALSPDPEADSLRHRVLEVVRDLAGGFPTPPLLRFDGPVDLIARGPLTEDVVAVVRESLANAAKHASAEHVGVTIRAGHDAVEVEVWDDGIGMPAQPVRSGLANLARRADARLGTFATSSSPAGTRIVWRVPVEPEGAA